MSERFDFAIVGAGMAGASLAAGFAAHGRVVILEAEDRPGVAQLGRRRLLHVTVFGLGQGHLAQ
jgi:D-arginine dehydrogenase